MVYKLGLGIRKRKKKQKKKDKIWVKMKYLAKNNKKPNSLLLNPWNAFKPEKQFTTGVKTTALVSSSSSNKIKEQCR